jgi:uncharacterized protein YegP (UPF0339 family)
MEKSDNYLSCKSYLGHQISTEHRHKTTLFFDKKTNKFYFALLVDNNEVLLKSEGYLSAKSRDNGLNSIFKNIVSKENFEILSAGKKYYFILKAANRKEIARSCDFSTSKKVEEIIHSLFDNNQVEQVSAIAENLLQSLKGYLNIEDYLNKERIWDSYGITGFAKFMYNDGKYYFAVYNPDGSLYLRSAVHQTENDRDNAFDLMESSILLEEDYKIELFEGKYYAVLSEFNDILAISRPFDTFIEAYITTPGGRPKEILGTIY